MTFKSLLNFINCEEKYVGILKLPYSVSFINFKLNIMASRSENSELQDCIFLFIDYTLNLTVIVLSLLIVQFNHRYLLFSKAYNTITTSLKLFFSLLKKINSYYQS